MDTEVLERILDGRGKPTNLSFTLLKDITENFSEYRQIGQGGFSTVYKGVLPNGDVAVKRIRNTHSIKETLFYREVSSLLNIEHENVVRFLGYCASTDQIAIQKEGSKEFNYAEIRERLLCFEHISNGSLQKYITDELRGLEWNTRYGIIRGICEGLYHLHEEKKIFHMDLKPDNILLDNDMVPKITDFGLSRLDEKTKTTSEHHPGTFGYCAPEYLHHGYMSFKSDMYGLGAIIIELVTGKKVITNNNYNNVLRRWRHRWKKSGKETPLVYQQVAKCIEIGLLCQELNPSKRPFIWEIIHDIREIEGVNGQISNAYEHSFGQITPYSDDDMLGIEPLELHFPFELNNQVPCTVQLTNETDSYIAFNIENTSPLSYCTVQPQKDIMSPRSSCTIEVTMQPQGKAPDYMHHANELTVWSTKVNDCFAVEEITRNMFINEEVNVVDQVHLDVVFEAQIVLPQPSLIHCMDMPLVLGTIVSKDQVDSTQPQEASAETSENICTENDDLDGVSDDNPPVPHDKHTASQKQKMHVPPSSVSTANAAPALQAPLVIEEHWVQCDTCQKWRLLPYKSDPTILPKVWKCSMQLWLPRMNRCDVGEKETTDALNARYDIPPRVVMEEHWVQCDTCHKSRLLPYELDPTTLPKEWKCSMQQWLPGMNRCGVGEKETTNALNALYVISPPANGIPSVGASSGVATACNTFSINGHAGQSRKRKNFAGDGSALVDSSRPTQASAYSKITQPRPRIKSTVDNNHYPSERDSVSKSVDVSTEKKKSKRKNRGSYSDGGDLAERSKKLSKGKDNRERDYGESKAYKKIKK